MRLETSEGIVRVTLSERNLRSLLAKLEGSPRDSARTLTYATAGPLLVVSAETDDVHYAHPERDVPYPGAMHPDTERALQMREGNGTEVRHGRRDVRGV